MKWTLLHELKALFIYKKMKGIFNSKKIKEELAKDDIFSANKAKSVAMKLKNIQYLYIGEGLSGVSNQLIGVFKEYKDTSIEKLEQIIEEELKKRGK